MLAYILSYLATHEITIPDPNADEGAGAHLFQIWLVLQVLMISFFAIKWVPQKPKEAFFVLALQIFFALVPLSIVYYLEM